MIEIYINHFIAMFMIIFTILSGIACYKLRKYSDDREFFVVMALISFICFMITLILLNIIVITR